jgi:hypothetical protein
MEDSLRFQPYIRTIAAYLGVKYHSIDDGTLDTINDLLEEIWEDGYDQAEADGGIAIEDEYPEEFGY